MDRYDRIRKGEIKFLGRNLRDWPEPKVEMSRKTEQLKLSKVNSSKERYEKLKQMMIWNKKNGLWYPGLTEDGRLLNTNHYAYDQLLGVLSEYLFVDKPSTGKLLYELKSKFVDRMGFWWTRINGKGKVLSESHLTYVQLTGVLGEWFAGDKLDAGSFYRRILLDVRDEKSGLVYSKVESPGEREVYTFDQLLNLLVGYFIDREVDLSRLDEFKKSYSRLKDMFWDERNSLWCESKGSTRFIIDDQLIGVLDEYFLGDQEMAKETLSNLDTSIFKDEERNLWRYKIEITESGKKVIYPIFKTSSQLLGVFVEGIVKDELEMI